MNIKSVLKRQAMVYKLYNMKNGFWKRGLVVESVGAYSIINGIRVIHSGQNNRLNIGTGVRLQNCKIVVKGDNNVINIGDKCSLRGLGFYIEDNNNEINLGAYTTVTDQVTLSAIEGTHIFIGTDCMISSNIEISTGDGHAVCDSSGTRANLSRDISIGNHVWIGKKVIIGKGVKIGDNSIIGAGGGSVWSCH